MRSLNATARRFRMDTISDPISHPSSDSISPEASGLESGLEAEASPRATAARLADHPLLWLGALAALSLLTPYIPVHSQATALIGTVLSTFWYVWFVVRLASGAGRFFNAPSERPLWQILAWCALAIVLWALSEFVAKPFLQAIITQFEQQEAALPPAWRLIGIVNYTLRPLMLVAGAACGGVALSRLVRYPNMLGPLAGVAALIDIWGVLLGGIVSKLLTSPTTAPLAAKAMAPLPTVGGGHAGAGGGGLSIASVGTGDFLFLGLFFGVLWAHSMNARAAERWTTPLVTLALLAIALGLIPFLPGLLFIGLGAAIPNLKYLRYTREENFALLYAAILVALLTAGLYFAISSQLKEPEPGQSPPTRPDLRGNS